MIDPPGGLKYVAAEWKGIADPYARRPFVLVFQTLEFLAGQVVTYL